MSSDERTSESGRLRLLRDFEESLAEINGDIDAELNFSSLQPAEARALSNFAVEAAYSAFVNSVTSLESNNLHANYFRLQKCGRTNVAVTPLLSCLALSDDFASETPTLREHVRKSRDVAGRTFLPLHPRGNYRADKTRPPTVHHLLVNSVDSCPNHYTCQSNGEVGMRRRESPQTPDAQPDGVKKSEGPRSSLEGDVIRQEESSRLYAKHERLRRTDGDKLDESNRTSPSDPFLRE